LSSAILIGTMKMRILERVKEPSTFATLAIVGTVLFGTARLACGSGTGSDNGSVS
jgi:hypothetical protein